MKKSISIALASILISSMLLTSCADKITEHGGSDALGATNDIIATLENNGSTVDTSKNDETSANQNQTDSNENGDENQTDKPQYPVVSPTLNINGTSSEWVLKDGISTTFTTASTLSNTKFEVNIPVNEQGTYELNFKASLGLTRTFSSSGKKASLSVPKTVFEENEPIMISYSSSGLNTSTVNRPWIAITKNVGGLDKYICYTYVDKNSSGTFNARTDMVLSCEDQALANFTSLPAGQYKIYFIDESYAHTRNKSYWLHEEPINIAIVPKGSGTTVTSSGSNYGSAVVSVKNNIFCEGSDIAIDYIATNLTPTKGDPWLAIGKTLNETSSFLDYYTHWEYTKTAESGTKTFRPNNTLGAQPHVSYFKSLASGSYKIHYVSGSDLISGINYVEPIGINIAPAATLSAKLGSTSLLSTNDPYNASNVKKTITVTEADLANGYITVSFDFDSLNANTTYFLNVQNVSLVKQ